MKVSRFCDDRILAILGQPGLPASPGTAPGAQHHNTAWQFGGMEAPMMSSPNSLLKCLRKQGFSKL